MIKISFYLIIGIFQYFLLSEFDLNAILFFYVSKILLTHN